MCKYATPKRVRVSYQLTLVNLMGSKDGDQTNNGTGLLEAAGDDPCLGWSTFMIREHVTDLGYLKLDMVLGKAYVEVLEP